MCKRKRKNPDRTPFGPWTYGFESFGPAWRLFLFPVQRGGWKGSPLETGFYPWVQWNETYSNPITIGREGLIKENGQSINGSWSLAVHPVNHNTLRLAWVVEIREPVLIYGATAILDLPPAFLRYGSDGQRVYNTTAMENVNPREGELPDAKAQGLLEAGFAISDFSWLSLSDGEYTLTRRLVSGWHDPPTADLLIDGQNVSTWEIGLGLNGTWRDYRGLPPLQAPVHFEGVEELSVTGPGF